nr:MAG TPA: hypothetical protein [Caudoviricetes sp.]
MKTYIVRATAHIQLTAETDKPENIKSLIESALTDICDISADATEISIKEVTEGGK